MGSDSGWTDHTEQPTGFGTVLAGMLAIRLRRTILAAGTDPAPQSRFEEPS